MRDRVLPAVLNEIQLGEECVDGKVRTLEGDLPVGFDACFAVATHVGQSGSLLRVEIFSSRAARNRFGVGLRSLPVFIQARVHRAKLIEQGCETLCPECVCAVCLRGWSL